MHVYGMCIVQSTKTIIERVMPLILLQKKKYELNITYVEKKSPTTKVSSGESTKKLQHPRRVNLHRRNQFGLHTKPCSFYCNTTSQEEVAVPSTKKKMMQVSSVI
jgi:hypothetical protein